MSSLMRWDPIRDVTTLHDAMNQLFEQAVLRPGFNPTTGWSGVVGQMNVLETQGKYYCQVLLPGVNPDGVDLTVRQNTLSIKANLPDLLPEAQKKEAAYLIREFGTGEFSRSITFPKDVNGDAVEAHFERGILTIEIPLAEHAQPKRITIREADKLTGFANSQRVIEETKNQEPAHVN